MPSTLFFCKKTIKRSFVQPDNAALQLNNVKRKTDDRFAKKQRIFAISVLFA